MSGPRWPDIDPGDLDESGEPYEGYSSPLIDTSFHDHEMGRADRDEDPAPLGRCPCGGATRVIDSRNGPQNTVRRRRGCCTSTCLHRMTTYEVIADNAPIVDIVQLAVLLDQAVDLVRAASLVSGFDK